MSETVREMDEITREARMTAAVMDVIASGRQTMNPKIAGNVRDTIGNLIAEREALKIERDSAVERSQMMLNAKDHWRGRAESAESELSRLRKRLEEAERVIEPFAEFGRNNTDNEGWSRTGAERGTILVWFGPSDFRAAKAFQEANHEADR